MSIFESEYRARYGHKMAPSHTPPSLFQLGTLSVTQKERANAEIGNQKYIYYNSN